MVEDWLQKGIVEPSQAFGNLPTFPVAKSGNRWRLVIDARTVNELLIPVVHVPPLLSDLHAWMAPAKRVSSIDAAAFFHSFSIDRESRKFFSFSAGRHGRVQMTRLS